MLGKKVRLSAPAALVYPAQVIEVAVGSGDFVENGSLLLRFRDRDGDIKSIKAPFDCTIETVVARTDQIFETPGPLLDLLEGRAPSEEDIEPELTELSPAPAGAAPAGGSSATFGYGISSADLAAQSTGAQRGTTTGGEKDERHEQTPPVERPRMLYQKQETPRSGSKHGAGSPPSSDRTRKPSSAKPQLGKRLLVTALYLLAAPVLLYLVHEGAHPHLAPRQVDHQVHHELPGAVVSDLPTAVNLDNRNIARGQNVFGLARLPLGIHSRMLQAPELVGDRIIPLCGE